MATREELVEHLWQAHINNLRDPQWIENVRANHRRRPDDDSFGAGAALERMLAAGVPAQDIGNLCRLMVYEAVFCTRYALGDPGVDDGDVVGLHEIIGTAPGADFEPLG